MSGTFSVFFGLITIAWGGLTDRTTSHHSERLVNLLTYVLRVQSLIGSRLRFQRAHPSLEDCQFPQR
jgi:hypothetical protein